MKRSGRWALAGEASGFTAADLLIWTIVRQAQNFPPAAGILHLNGKSTSAGRRCQPKKRSATSHGVWQAKTLPSKLTGGFHRKIFPASPGSLTLLGKLFFPVQVNTDDSLHGRRRGT